MNKGVEILENKILSDDWGVLKKYKLRHRGNGGGEVILEREVYDRGNGAAILLYNTETKSVVLTRQFRLPTFLNGNPDGMLIEACAGLLDGDHPEEAIRRETEEETGYKIRHVQKVFETYMSPGSVTEILYLYVGEYDRSMKVSAGGGVDEEEQIEVMELPFDEAWRMVVDSRIKDGKTILLLQYLKIGGF